MKSRLAFLLVILAVPAVAQPPAPAASPSPASIAASVDPEVQKFLESHRDPCALASARRVPCFPVETEVQGKRYSVKDALARFGKDEHDRAGQYLPPVLSPHGTPTGGLGFDPVCTAKLAVRALKGDNNTYWVYRVWDTTGERVVMRDREYDPKETPVGLGYELVDKVTGECAALAAFRKADREARDRAAHPDAVR